MHAGVFNQATTGACVAMAKRAHVSTYAYFTYDAVLVAAQVLTNAVKDGQCHQACLPSHPIVLYSQSKPHFAL